jgi:hypothetical protein
MTSHINIEPRNKAEVFMPLRALLLACSAGAIGWIILAALAFGIYELRQ